MSPGQLFRLSGAALAIGGLVSVIVGTVGSLLFPDHVDPAYVANPLFVPLNLLGVKAAIIFLMGLPGLYARLARQAGVAGLLGVALISLTVLMFPIFLGLVQVLIFPYLATQAPQLVQGEGPPGFFPFIILATLAQVVGAILFALPMLRGRVLPRWPGYALVISALLAVLSFFLSGPDSPSTPLTTLVDVVSTDLFIIPLAWLGYELWSGHPLVTEHPTAISGL